MNRMDIYAISALMSIFSSGFLFTAVAQDKKNAICPGDLNPIIVEDENEVGIAGEGKDALAAEGPFTFEDIFDPRYRTRGISHSWIHGSDDLAFRDDSGNLMTKNAVTGLETVTVPASIFTENGVTHYWMSEDREWVLLAYDYRKQWRHSFNARYKLWNINDQELHDFPNGALSGESLQIARLGTKGHAVVFVFGNNLYYQASFDEIAIQITNDGKTNVISNGLPDWMYEEDVIHSTQAFYFSPDSSQVIFAKFNDTGIPLISWPLYGNEKNYFPEIIQVPQSKPGDIRNGKQGPTTAVQLYAFNTNDLVINLKRILAPPALNAQEHYYNQVTWRDDHNALITWVNRVQNRTIQMMCDVSVDRPHCSMFRDFSQKGGWVDSGQPSQIFVNGGKNMATVLQDDSTPDLHKQMTFLSTPERGPGVIIFRTSGPGTVYEVVGYDPDLQHIFYITNDGDSTERMLYRVGTDASERVPVCLTCNRGDGCRYVSASFSGNGKHYILRCHGPDIPQYFLKHVSNDADEEILENNDAHREAISPKNMPSQEFTTVEVNGGYKAPTVIYKPPNFDSNKKYPLFIYTYAGPDSTLVTKTYPIGGYSSNWLRFLSSSHNIVVATIDGRGTTGQGDKYMFEAYRKLGDVEIQDQIKGARNLRKLPYIDTSVPTAIYGWSGGGHTTANAMGDPSDVFQCGISVAPTIPYAYYNSAYTERYMAFATEDDNAGGYERQNPLNKVQHIRGKKYLIAHGSADDNVHFLHTTQMIKAMEEHDIPHHQLLYFDTNHDIAEYYNGKHLRRGKTEFLLERCWNGKYGRV